MGKTTPVLMTLVLAPIAVGIAYAVGATFGMLGTGAGDATTQRAVAVLTSRETWASVLWTVSVSGVATVLAFYAAVWCAEQLWDSAVGRRLALFPFAVPHVAGALGILLLIGQSGLLARLAFAAGFIAQPGEFPALVYDRFGLGLATAFFWKEFPFLVLTAFAVRATIPVFLIDAARSLGSSAQQVSRLVVRPLLVRGILPATVSVFAFLLGQYEMATILGPSSPPALAVLTFERTVDPVLARRGEAYALALLALGLAALLAWLYTRVVLQRSAVRS